MSPSQLVELGIVLKTDQDSSWIKITLNKYCVDKCNDLKLELRLQLRQRLEKDKGRYELVKRKDTRVYLHYIYS